MQDFVNAANCYEQLTVYYPDVEDYRIYYAQALYQACLYEEAMKVTVQIDSLASQGKVEAASQIPIKNARFAHLQYIHSFIQFSNLHLAGSI